MKITIKPHNEQYLEAIRLQLGMSSHAEALNYVLTMLRMKGFSLMEGEKYIPIPEVSANEVKPMLMREIVIRKKPSRKEPEVSIEEEFAGIDPMIERLINSGLEMEF